MIALCTLLKREGPPSNIKKHVQKITLKNIREFTEFHPVIVRDFRILIKNFILKILKCTEMHYKSWFEAFFCEVFLTIAVAQLHFLKFSQWLRCLLAGWAEYQNQYISKMEQFYYVFSKPFLPFPSLVILSAKYQILRSIWRIMKRCIVKSTIFDCLDHKAIETFCILRIL